MDDTGSNWYTGMARGNLTRRTVLRGIGGGTASVGLVGQTGASTDDKRVVVGTKARRVNVAADRAKNVEKELDFGDIGKAVVGRFNGSDVAALQRSKHTRYVEEDVPVQAFAEDLPWGVDRVDADVVQSNGEDGSGADVAVLDTGIDSDHPDLQANLGTGHAVTSCSGTDCAEPWDDDHNHGTHVAGIADAVDNAKGVVGVASGATLHAVKVLAGDGSGSSSDVADGITWATDQGYDVVNMSLGASTGSSVMHDAVQYAASNGTLVVAAAGNDGPCTDCVGYPAAYSECIAVSSTDSSDGLSSFSSTGPEVDLAAPGSGIPSTVIGGYASYSGTSMATPHVAGAAAVLMANGLTASEARSALESNAESIGLATEESGNGLLDVEAAVANSGGGDGGSDPEPLGVTTGTAGTVGTTDATLNGDLTGLGGADGADVGFTYWEAGARSNTEQTVSAGSLSATGGFDAQVSGLAENTSYDFEAWATTTDGSATGNTSEFTTADPNSSGFALETRHVTDKGSWAVRLHGDLTSMDDSVSSVQTYFDIWRQGDKAGTLDTDDGPLMTSTGAFDELVAGLDEGVTYEYVAYGVADDGTEVRGTTKSFVNSDTALETPTVATDPASDVTQTAATLNGDLSSLGGDTSADVGFTYWVDGDRSNTERSVTVGTAEATGTFQTTVEALSPGTTYGVVAWAENSAGRSTGSTATFTTASETTTAPTVSTGGASDVSTAGVTLAGDLTDLGSAESVDVGFRYWQDGARSTTERSVSAGSRSSAGTFQASVSSLDADTTYRFVATAAGDGDATGSEATFTTGTTPPSVTTGSASNVDASSASIAGDLSDLGTASTVDVGFTVWEDGAHSTTEQPVSAGTKETTGTFSATASSLAPATTYRYVATAAGDGTDTGTQGSFTTDQETTTGPSVATNAPSYVDGFSAVLEGEITDAAGVGEFETYFEYWIEGQQSTTLQRAEADDVGGAEAFDDLVLGLQGGTTYVCRAVAIGSDGSLTHAGTATFTTE
jgi:subtilisin family serine protease